MSAREPLDGHSSFNVSVIIPAYNYAHFLPQAVDSALRQELPATEILIIDDGSTDDTAQAVASRYGHLPQVRYIHKKNAGLSAARNTGIQSARCDFVAFLDADDQWMPGFLRIAAARFAELGGDFAIVACRAQFVGADGAALNLKRLVGSHSMEITRAHILMRTQFSPSAVVARRAVFAECGDFDTTLHSSEDRDMWIRIAARKRVFLNGERFALIRRHSTSMSAHADRMKQNIRRTLVKARRDPQAVPMGSFFWLRVNAFFYFQSAWMYYEEGRRVAALRDMLVSILLWPFFGEPRRLNEPPGFRVRSIWRFLFSRGSAGTAVNPR